MASHYIISSYSVENNCCTSQADHIIERNFMTHVPSGKIFDTVSRDIRDLAENAKFKFDHRLLPYLAWKVIEVGSMRVYSSIDCNCGDFFLIEPVGEEGDVDSVNLSEFKAVCLDSLIEECPYKFSPKKTVTHKRWKFVNKKTTKPPRTKTINRSVHVGWDQLMSAEEAWKYAKDEYNGRIYGGSGHIPHMHSVKINTAYWKKFLSEVLQSGNLRNITSKKIFYLRVELTSITCQDFDETEDRDFIKGLWTRQRGDKNLKCYIWYKFTAIDEGGFIAKDERTDEDE